MNSDIRRWYLDFNEKDQQWHIDLKRVPENPCWVNIGYGKWVVLDHFCDTIDMMRREFGWNFTTQQVIRLAECTPWLTVYNPTSIPEDEDKKVRHMTPINSRKEIESYAELY